VTGLFIRKKCGIKTHNMLKVLNLQKGSFLAKDRA
jgi:hypothetical protein